MYECNDMMSVFILKSFSKEKNVDIVESGSRDGGVIVCLKFYKIKIRRLKYP